MSDHTGPPPTTGVTEVDDTLAELAPALGGPLGEQVGAVERAQDRLRRALDIDAPAATAS